MKITALKDHKCYCCGTKISSGQECFAFIVNPTEPARSEFDVLFTCMKCADQEACRTRIRRKSAAL